MNTSDIVPLHLNLDVEIMYAHFETKGIKAQLNLASIWSVKDRNMYYVLFSFFKISFPETVFSGSCLI